MLIKLKAANIWKRKQLMFATHGLVLLVFIDIKYVHITCTILVSRNPSDQFLFIKHKPV